ncbi:transcriptional regulator GcvA [Ramlibacter albus]|uniref:Transcriptional regulator GcvA n=1 Tax=Ramlibacter albus TaxID=2079448 RepID=A0A923MDA8_9BURK|nr:transcriptional regulator GcvA [Ramlibacter albus]MBC5767426.1 transcriptional regulator GcvA [Ramlibacter albus]
MNPPAAPRARLSHLQAWVAFEAAARTGTFAGAAEELSVTPAAVSQHIRTLEEYLGVRLFVRSAQGVSLTPEAQLAFPGIRDGLQRVADAVHGLQHRELDRIVRVSTSPSFASRWLLPRIHRFSREHESMCVNLDSTTRLVDFFSENVDVSIRYGKGNYPGLLAELLFEERVFPVCSPFLLSHEPMKAPLDILRTLPLIHDTTSQNEAELPTWRSWMAERGITDIDCSKGLYLGSMLAAQAAVDGRGVLLGRSVIVADDLAAGRLVRPFAHEARVPQSYYIVMRPDCAAAPKVAAFRKWLQHEAALTREAEAFNGA